MVQAARLKKRFDAIPRALRDTAERVLEEEAAKLVTQMNSIKPLREIEIDWTWGDAPAGSLTIGKVFGQDYGKIAITIYAKAPQGSGFSAAWFEFGTGERVHPSGKSVGAIPESPFMFPVYRANRSRVKGRLTRAIKKTIKES